MFALTGGHRVEEMDRVLVNSPEPSPGYPISDDGARPFRSVPGPSQRPRAAGLARCRRWSSGPSLADLCML